MEIKEHLKKYIRVLPQSVNFSNTCLLIIDCQNYFKPLVEEILDNLIKLRDFCLENGIKVIFTRHGHSSDGEDTGMLGKWWRDYIVRGSRDWELVDQLKIPPPEIIIEKNRYSAFYQTELDGILSNLNIENVIISGVMTNLCCETTAREAFVRDYRVIFLKDATATVHNVMHQATLLNLAYGFAHIISTNELIDFFKDKVN